jgi:hypothetical protein
MVEFITGVGLSLDEYDLDDMLENKSWIRCYGVMLGRRVIQELQEVRRVNVNKVTLKGRPRFLDSVVMFFGRGCKDTSVYRWAHRPFLLSQLTARQRLLAEFVFRHGRNTVPLAETPNEDLYYNTMTDTWRWGEIYLDNEVRMTLNSEWKFGRVLSLETI